MVDDFRPEQLSYPTPEPELRITEIEALKILFSTQRQEIIEHLIDQPRSVQEVARILQKPVHRLYYHFHKLQDYGFIRLVRTQSHPGAVEEKFYHISAYRMVIDRTLLIFHQESSHESAIQNILDEARSWITKDLDAGRVRSVNGTSDVYTALIHRKIAQIPKDKMQKFQQQLLDLLNDFTDDQHEEFDKFQYALMLLLHPTEGSQQLND